MTITYAHRAAAAHRRARPTRRKNLHYDRKETKDPC